MSAIGGVSGASSVNANNALLATQSTSFLTPQQQLQVQQILQNAQTDNLSLAQVEQQISNVLTPAQQSQLQSQHHGGHHGHHGGGGDANPNLIGGDTDEFGIPTNLTSASTVGNAAISNIATAFSFENQQDQSQQQNEL